MTDVAARLRTDGRLPAIRMVVVDVDATLVSDTGSVDAAWHRLLAQLRRHDILPVLCTGRAQQATDWLARELAIDYYICSNGASVHRNDDLLWDATIPADLTARIVAWFVARGMACVLSTPEGYLTTSMTPAIESASAQRRCWPTVVRPARWRVPAYKLQLWSAGHLDAACHAEFGDHVAILSHPQYLSVGPRDVDKGVALARLARAVGVRPSQILSIGDDRNDIPMFRHSAIAVAVGPAAPEVVAAADYWLPSEGGTTVADVLSALTSAGRG
jgi:hypothetical protein